MTTQQLAVSNAELVKDYSKLAGYLSWQFVRRSATLGSEDAEDFASSAIVRLIQCPFQYRDQPAYIKRLILNSIIKDCNKALKMAEREVPIELLIGSTEEANA